MTNSIVNAARKTTPFCARPSQKCPAPGMAHAARHNSTSVPGSVAGRARSAVVDLVAIDYVMIAHVPGCSSTRSRRTNSHPATAPSGSAAVARTALPGLAAPVHSIASVIAVGTAAKIIRRRVRAGTRATAEPRRQCSDCAGQIEPRAASAHGEALPVQVERAFVALMADERRGHVDGARGDRHRGVRQRRKKNRRGPRGCGDGQENGEQARRNARRAHRSGGWKADVTARGRSAV